MLKNVKILFGAVIGLSVANLSGTVQAMQTQELKFYDNGAPFYEFTNFYAAPFTETGVGVWKTSEHYFQGKKFNLPATRTITGQIMSANTPREVFTIAQQNKAQTRSDWHGEVSKKPIGQTMKDNVMLNGLRLKFSQNPQLAALLMSTQGSNLVENTEISTQNPKDSYWGNAYANGRPGENRLGISLMQVRNELLQGTLQVDCSKTGASLTPATQQAMNQALFNASLARICPGSGGRSQGTQSQPTSYYGSSSYYQGGSTSTSQPAYDPVGAARIQIESAIETSLMNMLYYNKIVFNPRLPYAFDISFEITPSKNMLINVGDANNAMRFAQFIHDYSDIKSAVDLSNPQKVFIPGGSIEYFLKEVLGIDQPSINDFKAANGIR